MVACKRQLTGLLGILLALAGCQSQPSREAELLAVGAGATSALVRAGAHYHRLYYRTTAEAKGDELRVYLAGDGRAFLNRYTVAADPTPEHHLTLRLMLQDPGPAVFVSRPCYYGTLALSPCDPALWTTERYSDAVVSSIAGALESGPAAWHGRPLHLIGYSGGGVIALKLAARLPGVRQVTTLASPLDTDAWTGLHGYTPLAAGQNPALLGTWPPAIRQLHLAGADDKHVPPGINTAFEQRMQVLGAEVRFITLQGYDHRCCWERDWPQLLRDLAI